MAMVNATTGSTRRKTTAPNQPDPFMHAYSGWFWERVRCPGNRRLAGRRLASGHLSAICRNRPQVDVSERLRLRHQQGLLPSHLQPGQEGAGKGRSRPQRRLLL
jgi:hypothetical protein